MSDPFLNLPGTKRKRPSRPSKPSSGDDRRGSKSASTKKRRLRDVPSESESEDEIGPGALESDIEGGDEEEGDEESEHEDETPAERRLRLAKDYLEQVRLEAADEFDAADLDRDIIAERLKEDVAEMKGKVYKHIADSLTLRIAHKPILHKYPVTSVCVHGENMYTGCKDGVIEKWDLTDSRRPTKVAHVPRVKDKKVFKGHIKDVLCLAISSDGKRLASGGSDKRICVWDTAALTPLKTFTQHRGPVMGLACRPSTSQIYSTSADRTLKLWSLSDLSYIETLFGHQDAIPAVASFTSERCLSVGARDRSARLWKIADETQLVFQIPTDSHSNSKALKPQNTNALSFPQGSMDCVSIIDEQHFLTGSDNGDIILWTTNKKKPQFLQKLAHGVDEPLTPQEFSAESVPVVVNVPAQPRWITSLAALPFTDLFFSGSWDGKLGMWKISEDLRKFELIRYIDVGIKGVINGICVEERGKRGAEGLRVVLAVGSECRLGRWKRVKGGRNGAVILEFGYS